MSQYVFRRILLAVPVIIGILVVTFTIARLIPGDPCTAALGERATVQACEAFNERMGLDQPLTVQLGIYMRNVLLRGDFGDSIRFSRPVSIMLIERLPVTIELGVAALAIAIAIGVPAGIISAVRRNSTIDVVTMIGANIGVSMPVYWLGLMLAYVFAILLKDTPFWLPPSGRLTAGLLPTPFYEAWGWQLTKDTTAYLISDFISNLAIINSILTFQWNVLQDALRHLILPAVALSTIPMAIIARITRSSMLDVLGREYVRAARAKGVSERQVVLKHALRNAMLPIITVIGLQVGTLFAGAVLTETIFGFSGVGRALFDAITGRDFPVIQAFTVVIAIGYVLVNMLVDLSYAFIDPRIKLQ
ncbi:MAG: ABC transporter permease [Chloroflexi bacterium]|nr:ABC transporter permease [Chloroflexota bacterium]MQC26651.1 ABC transporter permease [Chloroflexota bacterium]